jgi:hypothetical protein
VAVSQQLKQLARHLGQHRFMHNALSHSYSQGYMHYAQCNICPGQWQVQACVNGMPPAGNALLQPASRATHRVLQKLAAAASHALSPAACRAAARHCASAAAWRCSCRSTTRALPCTRPCVHCRHRRHPAASSFLWRPAAAAATAEARRCCCWTLVVRQARRQDRAAAHSCFCCMTRTHPATLQERTQVLHALSSSMRAAYWAAAASLAAQEVRPL